jgi:hypothetical protein
MQPLLGACRSDTTAQLQIKCSLHVRGLSCNLAYLLHMARVNPARLVNRGANCSRDLCLSGSAHKVLFQSALYEHFLVSLQNGDGRYSRHCNWQKG